MGYGLLDMLLLLSEAQGSVGPSVRLAEIGLGSASSVGPCRRVGTKETMGGYFLIFNNRQYLPLLLLL